MAKAKKKTAHINKITPAVAINSGTLFDKLSSGKCFLMNDGLYIKEVGGDQIAVNLATGDIRESLCGTLVTPVTVSITWLKK